MVKASRRRLPPVVLPDVGAFASELREEIVKAFPPAPAPPSLRLSRTPAPEPDPDREARRHARIVAGHRLVVAEAVRRMFTREKGTAPGGRPKTPSGCGPGSASSTIATSKSSAAALTPGITAHCAYAGLEPEGTIRQLVESWCDESKRQLHALLDRQPVDLPAEVEAMLVRWEVERLHGIPDAVMHEEMVTHG